MSSFLKKVESDKNAAVRDLVKALYVTIGNKGFMHEIEQLFYEKLTDLSPNDENNLYYLIRALRSG